MTRPAVPRHDAALEHPAARRDGKTPAQQKLETGRPFRAALIAALAQSDDSGEKIRQIADALIEKAIGGDLSSIKEIADRIDGKTAQPAPDKLDEPAKVTFEWKGE